MYKASDVKDLREKTGAGMLDCKKALEATNGNIDEAIDWLREKGISKAAKKADRIAAEGVAAIKIDGNTAAVVEVNSETDFVAKNDEFKALVDEIEKHLSNSMRKEIASEEIGELLMGQLKDLDEVAYVRFASVYREFKDVNTFMQEIKKILDAK